MAFGNTDGKRELPPLGAALVPGHGRRVRGLVLTSRKETMIASDVERLVNEAVAKVAPGETVDLALGPPKNPEFGDFTTPVALVLQKRLKDRGEKANTVDIGKKIAELLRANPLFSKIDVAGPGHLNLTLSDAFWIRQLADLLAKRERFGTSEVGGGAKVLVEYVSANPTGPLHVGHARNAAVADTTANLLAASGHSVSREFYVNDLGAQMNNLGRSVWFRYAESLGKATFPAPIEPELRAVLAPAVETAAGAALKLDLPSIEIEFKNDKPDPGEAEALSRAAKSLEGSATWFTKVAVRGRKLTAELGAQARRRWDRFGGLYYGEYVKELAAAFRAAEGEKHLAGSTVEDGIPEPSADAVSTARDFAHPIILEEQKKTLAAYGVRFDRFFSERSLHEGKLVDRAVEDLRSRGELFDADGALWFGSKKHGDDKDRVLRKSDGSWTYFAPDIAYHRDKLQRGFQWLVNAWGADHHGYIPRMRAALEALGFDAKERFHVILIQMVRLMRGGQEVKMSKRSGSFVTLQEVIDEVGPDAARYLMLIRSSDSSYDFDLDLAKQKSNDNPVFYVQYGHARVCSVFAKNLANVKPASDEAGLAPLSAPMERDLIKRLARFPEEVAGAAARREPHRLPAYLADLVRAFHGYYSKKSDAGEPEHRIVSDDVKLTAARLALADAVRTVLANGLKLCGVSAPERMDAAEREGE